MRSRAALSLSEDGRELSRGREGWARVVLEVALLSSVGRTQQLVEQWCGAAELGLTKPSVLDGTKEGQVKHDVVLMAMAPSMRSLM